jgi:hypothetical protein
VGRNQKNKGNRGGLLSRTGVVWLSFLAAMTLVIGVLDFGDGDRAAVFIATNMGVLGTDGQVDPVFDTEAQIDDTRWMGIVIHHLGEPAGDAGSIHRLHLDYGYQGLGYHFIIGNGNGLGDGVVQVGYRWNQQLPGVHTAGPAGEQHNRRSIGICLVGNGNRRPFTKAQLSQLESLTRRLQQRLHIPARSVHLHQDLSEAVQSPGRFFPVARFKQRLINPPH